MSLLSDYYDTWMNGGFENFSVIGAIKSLYGAYEGLYNDSHGADRYKLSQIPGFGTWKRFEDKAQYYQDYYDITGRDPRYASDYGNGGIPGVSDLARGFTPVRMARQLARMYGAEVELNIQRAKVDVQRARATAYRESAQSYRESQQSAEAWTNYERTRQRRR